MTTISQKIAEQQVENLLRSTYGDLLAQPGRNLTLKSYVLDAGWVITYQITHHDAVDPNNQLLGAPPYFVDKYTGTIHLWGRNTDFQLQGLVYEATYGPTSRLPWPQIFTIVGPEDDHLLINLRPNYTLCRQSIITGTVIRPYGEVGGFDRLCMACLMAIDAIGPFCWTCGRRMINPTTNYCDVCSSKR
jgi:hypothetical protein